MEIKLMSKKEHELNVQIIKDFNSILGRRITGINDVLDFLSEEFAEIYSRLDDAQDAFNTLADEYSELMNKYCFVYSLSGDGTWEVGTGYDYKEDMLEEYLKVVNNYYDGLNAETLDDILCKLERVVEKTMSNAGCDMFTALNLTISEDLPEFCDKDIFAIVGADAEPRIEILY